MPSIRLENVSLQFPVMVPLAAEDPDARGADDGGDAGAVMNSDKKKVRFINALENVSFELKSGQRLGLIGRNGSGKSTLLRVLGGIYEPTAGRVRVEGHVAPMFNINLGIQKEATGRRNIIIRGLLSGLNHKQAAAKIDEIAEFSGLGRFLDMPVRTYSQGMSMRLAFATATAFSPEILLLDEWIGAGDAEFRDKARERMNNFVDKAGITVIASHNRGLLESVCSLGLWLDRGVMRAFGPIGDVYDAVDEWRRERKLGAMETTISDIDEGAPFSATKPAVTGNVIKPFERTAADTSEPALADARKPRRTKRR